VVLHHDDVLLRPWQVDDARWYVEARDEEVFKWTTELRELTVSQAEAAIERVNGSDDVLSFAVADPQSCELLGNIALVRDNSRAFTGEVMYWLAPHGRGRGVATKAVTLLCVWALTNLSFEQIALKTHMDNVPSQRVADRAGFRRVEQEGGNTEPSEDVWYVMNREELKPPLTRRAE
jgi:[ribosomal protein S5]-alanine N-acetyltransferase